jgi:hypothetical protein
VVFQVRLFAAMADGMEVERKGICFWEQDRRQLCHPSLEKFLLMLTPCAIRVVGGKALFGQDVEAGKQPQRLVTVEIVDVAEAFLVEQLEYEQAHQSVGCGNHFRARIAGLLDQFIEAKPGQQRQEQEHSRMPSDQPSPRLQR